MSDRIAVFNEGRIEQIAAPPSVYDRPRTRFVAEFIGETRPNAFAAGSYSSAEVPSGVPVPPTIKTLPVARRTAL